MVIKNLDDYMGLPYTIEVIRDAGEEYSGLFARVVELPGCMTQASTFEELGEMIEDAMHAWIESALENGLEIPEPRQTESYSGKFVIRIPRSLHRELVEASNQENVSLNLFVSTALGKAVGRVNTEEKKEEYEGGLSPAVSWPRLSEKARVLLVAHGYSAEVQEVDGQLFASWIDAYLDQAKVALERAEYQDALNYVRPLRQGLELLCSRSPIIRTYCQAIALLENQISTTSDFHSGLVEQDQIKRRVLSEIRNYSRISPITIDDTAPDQDILNPLESRRIQTFK